MKEMDSYVQPFVKIVLSFLSLEALNFMNIKSRTIKQMKFLLEKKIPILKTANLTKMRDIFFQLNFVFVD